MLAITYGPVYRPKLDAQKYDVVLDEYDDKDAAKAIYELLKDKDEDVYIEYGRTYIPMFRGYAFTSIDYTLIYVPRSQGIDIYVPRAKLGEFVEMLGEYMKGEGALRDFIVGRLRERGTPYLYPNVALYYDKHIYLYLGMMEVALPG